MPSSVVKPFSAEGEYKKDTGITKDDVTQFRQWILTQPHLPEEVITDLDLILSYHSCKHSMAVSRQVLDLNLTLRTLFTAFFKDRWVDARVEHILDTILMTPLRMRARDGSAVLYTKILNSDPKLFMFTDAIRTALMVIDLWQLEKGTWPGFMIVFDLEGIRLGHLSRMGLQDLQQFFYYLQEAMFVKVRGLHFLNAPSFMDRLMMMMRPFIKKELIDGLHIHQVGSRSLDKWFDMKGLPKEAGGEERSLRELQELSQERFRANNEYFKAENKKRVCESVRPGKPKNMSDLFHGMEGSFKKLDID